MNNSNDANINSNKSPLNSFIRTLINNEKLDKICGFNVDWAMTPGLFQVRFHSKPQHYTKRDLIKYKDILINTNVYKRHYQPGAQIKGAKAFKYQRVIRPLFNKKSNLVIKGSGLSLKSLDTRKTIYTYWDDPKELVDRLRLLLSSESAGHNNHKNEVISVVEELRETNFGEGLINHHQYNNSKLKTNLLKTLGISIDSNSIDFHKRRLCNLIAPTDTKDAVTKAYLLRKNDVLTDSIGVEQLQEKYDKQLNIMRGGLTKLQTILTSNVQEDVKLIEQTVKTYLYNENKEFISKTEERFQIIEDYLFKSFGLKQRQQQDKDLKKRKLTNLHTEVLKFYLNLHTFEQLIADVIADINGNETNIEYSEEY
uniref:DUF8207 domain-containing protein n=1 Tax=Glossina palpalis gambiensis TaxID=67801 RepID=A0A1B0BXI6_9MUSC